MLLTLTDMQPAQSHADNRITIGLADSGVASCHSAVDAIAGGISIRMADDQPVSSDDYQDHLGHGTACAGILRKFVPDAELFIVRIFEQHLDADARALAAAIHWLVDHHVHLINLSLCEVHGSYPSQLREACEHALEHDVLLVSAEAPPIPNLLPEDLPNLLKVLPGNIRHPQEYYYLPDAPRERFVARGSLQKVAWIPNGYALREGASYAAPHLTGVLAQIRQAHPSADVQEVNGILRSHAKRLDDTQKEALLWRACQLKYRPPRKDATERWRSTRERVSIRKAALYPYREQTQLFVKYPALLDFEVVGVADTLDSGWVGKPVGKVGNVERWNVERDTSLPHSALDIPHSLRVVHSLEVALRDADTLIVGDVEGFSRASRTDVLQQVMSLAVRYGKNVYSLTTPEFDGYEQLQALAQAKGLWMASPVALWPREAERQCGMWSAECGGNQSFPHSALATPHSLVPLVAVFGTGVQQGKFETQLVLRRKLSEEGYRVAHLGTDLRSELFEAEACFPYETTLALKLPTGVQMACLQQGLEGVCRSAQPDIVVTGAPLEVVPPDIHFLSPGIFATMSLLGALKPDAYILVVDNVDSPECIQHSIQVLEGVGKGKVLALVLNEKKWKRKPLIPGLEPVSEHLSLAEREEALVQLEQTLRLPVVSLAEESGHHRLVKLVMDYFTEEGPDA